MKKGFRMNRNAFTLVEIIVSILLISLLLILVSSTISSLINFENKQERQISGNEYIYYLRKKALSYSGTLTPSDFYSDGTDQIAELFYEMYDPNTDYPHQTEAPTSTKITDGGVFYINHFFLQYSNNPNDKATETIFTAPAQK
ncbi:MAG: hypothetical protein PWQ84_1695 [Thermotogaceae bacterium]|nr:hypothetical protein [Thermotogaceae bacterium]